MTSFNFKVYISLAVIVTLSVPLKSQNYIDLLKVNYGVSPNNQFENSTENSDYGELSVDATIPIVVNEKTAILTGGIFERLSSKIDPFGTNRNFNSATLKLGVNTKHSDQWSGTYLLLPKMSADRISLDGSDFQLGAVALMKFKKNDNLKYKAGLYYNSELFGPLFVPLFGLYYLNESKKFEANITLPLAVDLNYNIVKKLKIGTNFLGAIKSYDLDNFAIGDEYMARANNEVFGYLQHTFFKNVVIQAKVGYAIGRSLRVYKSNDKIDYAISAIKIDDNRNQLNTDYADGIVFKVRLLYRLKL